MLGVKKVERKPLVHQGRRFSCTVVAIDLRPAGIASGDGVWPIAGTIVVFTVASQLGYLVVSFVREAGPVGRIMKSRRHLPKGKVNFNH
jgi:hypothetical protein